MNKTIQEMNEQYKDCSVRADEDAARKAFLSRKEQQTSRQSKVDIKKLNDSRHRFAELDSLMQSVYEDKVMGENSGTYLREFPAEI